MSQPQTGTSFARWLEEDGLDEEEPGRGLFGRRRLLLIGLAAVLLLALGGGAFLLSSRVFRSNPVQYQFGTTSTGNVTVTVSSTGPIASTAVYNLNFPGSGTLTELDVSVGQQVQTGQVLARIDPTSLQDAVNQAQAQVNSAWISYQNALLNLKDVKAQNDPCPTTATPPATAKTQQQCNLAIDQAQEQVNSAWSNYETAKAQLQTAKDNLGNAVMKAPAAGTIVSINGTVGAQVGSGGGSNGGSGSGGSSAFIVLEDLSQLAITAQVNEADIASVKVGQSVRFTVSAYPSDTFFGTVTAISPLGQSSSGVVSYPVTVSVDNHSLNGANLLPGMTASLSITTQERIGAVLVPNKALTYARSLLVSGQISRSQVQSLLAAALQQAGSQAPSGTATFVAVMQNGKPAPQVIFTGLTDGTNTEVISGLQAGEQVLVGQTGGNATPTTTSGGGGGGIFGGGGGGRGGGGGGGGGGFGGGGG